MFEEVGKSFRPAIDYARHMLLSIEHAFMFQTDLKKIESMLTPEEFKVALREIAVVDRRRLESDVTPVVWKRPSLVVLDDIISGEWTPLVPLDIEAEKERLAEMNARGKEVRARIERRI